MSRKSDIDTAEDVFWWNSTHDTQEDLRPALAAAYDLGRAAQATADARDYDGWMLPGVVLRAISKRLRKRVRKMLEGK